MDFGTIRSIKGDTILSPSLPRLGIRISAGFIYLGNLHYISSDIYHVEQYIFIDPNGIGHVTRVLLIQFTGFLENKEGRYEFPAQPSVLLDGEEYHYEESILNIDDFARHLPHTELGHASDYIRQRSYTLAGEMRCQRFARAIGEHQRNELAITYLEAPEESGASAPAPAESGAAPEIDRALSSFTIVH